MRKTLIDVRDEDYSWWERIEAYRDGGQLHLPRASVERLGEVDAETGNASLINGQIEAAAGIIRVDGDDVPVWTVGAEQLVARASRQMGRWDRGRE